MVKKIVGFIKLQIPAGKANPSPPVGPALGQRGLNIMEFCKAFNAQTQGMEPGLMLPVVITAFADKSFTFIMKTPPATVLIKKAAKVDKGSPKPHTDKVGKLTRAQAEEIAKTKMPDLTAADMDAAVRTAASKSAAVKSGIFIFAISSACARVNLPTLSVCGLGLPLSILAAFLMRTVAGGVFMMKVKLLSSKAVITTGIGRPGSIFCVAALNALQNSMMLRPRWPSAGPMGGLGLALPAGTCNLMNPTIFFAMNDSCFYS